MYLEGKANSRGERLHKGTRGDRGFTNNTRGVRGGIFTNSPRVEGGGELSNS